MFEWDADNLHKLVPHKLTADEVESAFFDDFALPGEPQLVDGEERLILFGMANAGGIPLGILRVIYTLRGDRIRVITAHSPTHGQLRRYQLHRVRLQYGEQS